MRWLAALGLALIVVAVPVGLTATATLTAGAEPAARPSGTQTWEPTQVAVMAAQPGDFTPYELIGFVEQTQTPTVEPSEDPRPPKPTYRPGFPVRLMVPELGVNARIVPIRAPGGVLLPPSDPQVLGWWRDGARPGARHGGALITGHTVHSGGGAFDHLETLTRGDRVKVRTKRGTVTYVVTHVRIYRKSSLAQHAGEVFSQKVPGRLVLITCEGWNGAGYDSNAVVLARPI